jgi:hypothetical protein
LDADTDQVIFLTLDPGSGMEKINIPDPTLVYRKEVQPFTYIFYTDSKDLKV